MQEVFIALGLGLLASLSACVYPLIPVVTAMFSGGQVTRWYEGFALAGIYVVGMAVTYVSLAVVTALTSGIFGGYMGKPAVIILFALLFFLLALVFLELIPFPLPRIAEHFQTEKKSALLYPLILGIFSGFIAAPCTAPLFGKVMADIASSRMEGGTVTKAVLQGLAFSFGMGIPFLLVGGFSVSLPKSGSWLQIIKFLGAAVLFAAGFHYLEDLHRNRMFPGQGTIVFALTGIVLFLVFFILTEPRKIPEVATAKTKSRTAILLMIAGFGLFMATTPFSQTHASTNSTGALKWHTSLEDAQDAAGGEKRILIDFWAEWCTACFEMEEHLFNSAEFIQLVRENDLVLARLDFTKQTDENNEIAVKYGIMGLPTLVLTDSRGEFLDSFVGFRSRQLSLRGLKFSLQKYKSGVKSGEPEKSE